MGKYRTIVVDPPWPIGDFPAWFDADRQSVRERELGSNPTPYGTMRLEEIAALPVRDLADVDAGAHLYLWTPAAFLWEARDLVLGWGFAPMYPLAWCKAPMGTGLGGTFASNIEFILFCRITKPAVRVVGSWQSALRDQRLALGLSAKAVCEAIGAYGTVNHGGVLSNWESGLSWPTWEQWQELKSVVPVGDAFDDEIRAGRPGRQTTGLPRRPSVDTRWFTWPRGRHSEKPEAFFDIVEQASPGPYAELFARRARLGWDYPIGDQALGGVAA